MKTVNIAELKNRLSHYLEDVRAGRELVVRDRDTPIALIVPISRFAGADDELRTLAAAGMVRLGSEALDEELWDLPAPRVAKRDLRRVLDADRAEE
jgi:prevent-host-death family protein